MHRIEFSDFGEPQNVLELADDKVPPPGAGQVRVHVDAAPINPADLLTVRGLYGVLPQRFPAVPGNEGVGRVTAVGDGVTHIGIDDLVLLPPGSGTWRSAMTLDAGGLFALPDSVDPLQLAMLSINPMSAYLMLTGIVDLKAGDWVMLNAANSAVGRYIVALAHQRGIHTLALVRRDGGVARDLKEIGASAVVVDQGQDIAAEVISRTGGSPIRLGLDAVGGPATNMLANSLCKGGTIAVYGVLSEQSCELDPAHAIFRDIRLVGFWLTDWLGKVDDQTRKTAYDEILELARAGRLRAEVAGTYPLNRVREAVTEAMRSGRNGKILFTPDTPTW